MQNVVNLDMINEFVITEIIEAHAFVLHISDVVNASWKKRVDLGPASLI